MNLYGGMIAEQQRDEGWPAGTLKTQAGDICRPHARWYSIAQFTATHYWCVRQKRWLPIYDDKDE